MNFFTPGAEYVSGSMITQEGLAQCQLLGTLRRQGSGKVNTVQTDLEKRHFVVMVINGRYPGHHYIKKCFY